MRALKCGDMCPSWILYIWPYILGTQNTILSVATGDTLRSSLQRNSLLPKGSRLFNMTFLIDRSSGRSYSHLGMESLGSFHLLRGTADLFHGFTHKCRKIRRFARGHEIAIYDHLCVSVNCTRCFQLLCDGPVTGGVLAF